MSLKIEFADGSKIEVKLAESSELTSLTADLATAKAGADYWHSKYDQAAVLVGVKDREIAALKTADTGGRVTLLEGRPAPAECPPGPLNMEALDLRVASAAAIGRRMSKPRWMYHHNQGPELGWDIRSTELSPEEFLQKHPDYAGQVRFLFRIDPPLVAAQRRDEAAQQQRLDCA